MSSETITAITLQDLNPQQVNLNNKLCSLKTRYTVPWQESQAELVLKTGIALPSTPYYIKGLLGSAPITLAASLPQLQHWLQADLGDVPLPSLPEPLQMAVLSQALAPWQDSLDTYIGEQWIFETLSTTSDQCDFPFTLEIKAADRTLLIWFDTFLPDTLPMQKQPALAIDTALLFTPFLRFGQTRLLSRQIASLNHGDIIFLDTDRIPVATPETTSLETALPETVSLDTATSESASLESAIPESAIPESASLEAATSESASLETATLDTATQTITDSKIKLVINNTPLWWVDITHSQVTIMETIQPINTITEGNTLNDLGDLPIPLTFEVGQIPRTLSELTSLQPGYVFDLQRDADQQVLIKANGHVVGECELVSVNQRLGVRVLSLYNPINHTE